MLASGPPNGGSLGGGGGVGGEFVQGLYGFTVWPLRSNPFTCIFGARQFSVFAAPCPPSLCSGKKVVSNLVCSTVFTV